MRTLSDAAALAPADDTVSVRGKGCTERLGVAGEAVAGVGTSPRQAKAVMTRHSTACVHTLAPTARRLGRVAFLPGLVPATKRETLAEGTPFRLLGKRDQYRLL